MGRTIGIDLGTTNSCVAYVINDRVETIPNSEGTKTTPSVVYFSGSETIVGELAKRQLVLNAGLVIRSAKRLMGRRFSEVQDHLEDFPYEVVEGRDDRAEIKLADGQIIPPEAVAAHVLTKMASTAEDFFGASVDAAVITVPAYFNDAQRTATKHAAEIAGLNVLRIINEPTAAALAYGFQNRGKPQKIAVFDFGGGTFDISILQLNGDIFEVLATNGNTQLGGDNVDLRIYQEVCDEILQQTGIDPTLDLQAVSRIREAAEKTKIELSSLLTTHISLPFIVADQSGPKHYERDVTREEFNRWMAPIFEALFEPCGQSLSDARLRTSDIDEIVLVGGSTRIPKVQEMVANYFGKPGNRSINPDEAIAVGASIQAGVMRGELQEVLLLDVTPLSIGIELAGGVFKPLIERNSSIPCEATRRFTTVIDNQAAVMVHVLQGERLRASENRTLARFRLTDIPPMPKEIPEIEVTFRIDADGIMEVSAVELTSGVQTGIHVEGYGEYAPVSDEEMQRILADKEAHMQDDADFLRTANRRAQAERIQRRMEGIFADAAEEFDEADIKQMKETMLRHDLAIATKDWNKADHHELLLGEISDKYEEVAERNRALNRELDLPAGYSYTAKTGSFKEELEAIEEVAEIPMEEVKEKETTQFLDATTPMPFKGSYAPKEKKQPAAVDPHEEVKAERFDAYEGEQDDEEEAEKKRRQKSANKKLAKDDGKIRVEDDFDLESIPPPPPPV